MKKIGAVMMLLIGGSITWGQSIENIQMEYFGDSLLIRFDIKDPLSNTYDLEVFASHDNFSEPLNLVSGDLKGVESGTNKRINWQISEELVDFSGQLAIEIRGNVVVLPVQFSDLPKKIKRGKEKSINWTGGKPAQGYVLRIEKLGVVIHEAPISDARSYLYQVPSKTRPGKYDIVLTSNDPKGLEVKDQIMISRKVPLGVQLSPVGGALIAGIIILLQPEPPKPLPEPPDPSDIN